MRKSNTNRRTSHQSISTLTFSTTTVGTSTTQEPKFSWSERTATTTWECCSMPEAHQLTNNQKKDNKTLKNKNRTSMTTTAKSQSISTKMANPNGCVLSSLSLNKTQKSLESDFSRTTTMKNQTDLKKETPPLPTPDLKSTVWKKLWATKSANSLKALVSTMHFFKMPPTSQSPTNTNFT